jgi:hypothetical protein
MMRVVLGKRRSGKMGVRTSRGLCHGGLHVLTAFIVTNSQQACYVSAEMD